MDDVHSQSPGREAGHAEPTAAPDEEERASTSTAVSKDQNFPVLVGTVVRAVPEVDAIYVYGSQASGTARSGSDLDVALLLRPGAVLPVFERVALAADLGASAGCDVDLSVLDLDRGVVHAKEVVVNGSAVFVADALAVARFEMSALSRYARLNEDREPVLRAYGIEATSRG
jgi:predicted nucleotidyltransferase